MKDFFISYNKADQPWAEWVAWTLEEANHSVVIQVWDFRPGGNFVLGMQEASAGTEKTIAILSDNYLGAEYTHPEWAAAFRQDSQGKKSVLIPVRVKECHPTGLLASIIYIDLVGCTEEEARSRILEGLKERAKPEEAPPFPILKGVESIPEEERVIPNPVQFPGQSKENLEDLNDIPWNVPTGITLFTGREEILKRLHETLMANSSAVIAQRQAISGLGGIGKTQTAIEYASRHRYKYDAVLWVAAESRETLISDFATLASVLNLPERNVQEQTLVIQAVKKWLETNSGWLLILDNADEPRIVEEFLPAISKGHVLLTSRAQVFDSLGILNPIELEEMTPEDAIEFLTKRTGRDDLEAEEAHALSLLTQELDFLPLALEQAGAYIKELRCSFSDYLSSYHRRGLELLEKGRLTGKYRKSVKTTWSLNFQQVEQVSKPSADLLCVSAFLNPDRIPTELIKHGARELGPELSTALENVESDPLALDEILKPLIQYSLIHRDRTSHTYDIHRLVQAVLKDGLDEPSRRLWVERTVKAVARVFPDVDSIDITDWERIERLISHAQICAELIGEWHLISAEAAQLLNLTGRYLHLRGRLSDVETFYAESFAINQALFGADHPILAVSLHNQAWLCFDQAEYSKAESLYLTALKLREFALGTEHIDVATTLNNLGWLYKQIGNYREADRHLRRALEISEKVLGVEHPIVAESLSHLASLYLEQSRFSDAEPIVTRSLNVLEKAYGREHYKVARLLGELGAIYLQQGKIEESESLVLRGIAIDEKTFGRNFPRVATGLNNLASIRIVQKRYEEAESLLQRSLVIKEHGLGANHPDTANVIVNLASLLRSQNRFLEAESLYERALTIREKSFGLNHPDVAKCLVGLGRTHLYQRKYQKGEPLLRRAILIFRGTFGPEHIRIAHALSIHAALLKGLNRKGEAQRLEAQAKRMQHKLTKKKPHKINKRS